MNWLKVFTAIGCLTASNMYAYNKIEEQKWLIAKQNKKIAKYKKLQRLEAYKSKDPKYFTDLEKKMKEIDDEQTKKKNLLYKNFLQKYTKDYDIEHLAKNLRTDESFCTHLNSEFFSVDKEMATIELENYWKPKGIRKIEMVEEYCCNDGSYHKIIWYR